MAWVRGETGDAWSTSCANHGGDNDSWSQATWSEPSWSQGASWSQDASWSAASWHKHENKTMGRAQDAWAAQFAAQKWWLEDGHQEEGQQEASSSNQDDGAECASRSRLGSITGSSGDWEKVPSGDWEQVEENLAPEIKKAEILEPEIKEAEMKETKKMTDNATDATTHKKVDEAQEGHQEDQEGTATGPVTADKAPSVKELIDKYDKKGKPVASDMPVTSEVPSSPSASGAYIKDDKYEATRKMMPKESVVESLNYLLASTSNLSSSSSSIQPAPEPAAGSTSSQVAQEPTSISSLSSPPTASATSCPVPPPRPTRVPPPPPPLSQEEIKMMAEKSWYAGGSYVLHIKDKFVTPDMKETTIMQVAEIITSHVGGMPSYIVGPAQAHDTTDALVMKIFDVACCSSQISGCCDITLGIAGPGSKNKSNNPKVRGWRSRIYMRGITEAGSTHRKVIAACIEILSEFGDIESS